jgi:hypothetical protein
MQPLLGFHPLGVTPHFGWTWSADRVLGVGPQGGEVWVPPLQCVLHGFGCVGMQCIQGSLRHAANFLGVWAACCVDGGTSHGYTCSAAAATFYMTIVAPHWYRDKKVFLRFGVRCIVEQPWRSKACLVSCRPTRCTAALLHGMLCKW